MTKATLIRTIFSWLKGSEVVLTGLVCYTLLLLIVKILWVWLAGAEESTVINKIPELLK